MSVIQRHLGFIELRAKGYLRARLRRETGLGVSDEYMIKKLT